MKRKGFSLLELLMVLAVIGCIALFAYPSYLESLVRARRAEAKMALLDAAHELEDYYLKHLTYQGAEYHLKGVNGRDSQGFYTVEVSIPDPDRKKGYLLKAIPQKGQQQRDLACQTFTYNDLGIEGVIPGPVSTPKLSASDCWAR